jgi:hypothetical protein
MASREEIIRACMFVTGTDRESAERAADEILDDQILDEIREDQEAVDKIRDEVEGRTA